MQQQIPPEAGKGKPQKVKPKCWSEQVTGNESALVGDDEHCVGGTVQLHFLCCENEHEIKSLAKHQRSEAGSAGWPLPGKQGDKGRNGGSKQPSHPLPAHPPSSCPSSWPGHALSHRADGIFIGALCVIPLQDPGGWLLRSKSPSSYPLHGLQAMSKNKALNTTAHSTVSPKQERSD